MRECCKELYFDVAIDGLAILMYIFLSLFYLLSKFSVKWNKINFYQVGTNYIITTKVHH